MNLVFTAKAVRKFLGGAILALLVNLLIAAISISGVQNMNAAIWCLWVAFVIFAVTLIAGALIYFPRLPIRNGSDCCASLHHGRCSEQILHASVILQIFALGPIPFPVPRPHVRTGPFGWCHVHCIRQCIMNLTEYSIKGII